MATLLTAGELDYRTKAIEAGGLIGGQSAEIAERVAKGEITIEFSREFSRFYSGGILIAVVDRETLMPMGLREPVKTCTRNEDCSGCGHYLPEAFERYLENRVEANRAARLNGGAR